MRTDFNADSKKGPDELEREVDEQRAHIAETLRALERKFSPGQIFDQVLGYTRTNGGDFSRNLMDTVKNNPVPMLLTATGLAWMMVGQNRPRSRLDGTYIPANASYGVETSQSGASYRSDAKGKATALKDKAGHLRQDASETMSRAKQRMHQFGSSAQNAKNNVRHQAERANQEFEHMLKEQPLALGAIGIVFGALIGASLPHTRKEDEILGSARDKLTGKAAKAAGEAYEKAQDVGSHLMEDAKEEVSSAQPSMQQASPTSSQRSPSQQPPDAPRYN